MANPLPGHLRYLDHRPSPIQDQPAPPHPGTAHPRPAVSFAREAGQTPALLWMYLPCFRPTEGVRFQTLRPAHRLTQRAMNFGAIRFGEQSDPSDMGLGPTDPCRAPIKNRPEIVRGRTSQIVGAAMTLCSRMLISLSILA